MKIIITGATGMVGEGVLLECLQNPIVEKVLIVNRKHYELSHPKLTELIVPDFLKLDAFTDELKGYDACFYCAGISSVGMSEEKYTVITYDTTLHFAKALLTQNPEMVFNFVSGSHTDSSEKGKIMWARVKGKTENDLIQLPFKAVYNFRPGGMKEIEGQKNGRAIYKYIVTILGWFIPKQIITLQELGEAMIKTVTKGYEKSILEIADIEKLAKL